MKRYIIEDSAFDEINDIDIDSLEEIEKLWGASKYDFPAVIFSKGERLYFNTYLCNIFAPDYLKFYATGEHLIMLPSSRGLKNSFRLTPLHSGRGKQMNIPADLKGKKIAAGIYKAYKYKDGICIKRYEPIAKEDMKSV